MAGESSGRPVLPEWRDFEIDINDEDWAAALEASRRKQLSELNDL